MWPVVFRIGDERCALDGPDARILSTVLLSRRSEAGEFLGCWLRDVTRARSTGSIVVRGEEEENTLRIAVAQIERDGLLSPALEELRTALDGAALV